MIRMETDEKDDCVPTNIDPVQNECGDQETLLLNSDQTAALPDETETLDKNPIVNDESLQNAIFGLCSFVMLYRIIGWCLYSTDVVTDIYSGANFIAGESIDYSKFGNSNFTNYTRTVCNDFDSYSHPIWGTLGISLAWAPGIALLPPLMMHMRGQFIRKFADLRTLQGSRKTSRSLTSTSQDSWTTTVFITTVIIIFWPLSGIIMCLRQFLDGGAHANITLQRFFSSAVFKRAGYFFKTDYVKLMEGCIEAPFQLAIQLFAILAGSFPGIIQILSICASLASIILHVEIGNGFINVRGGVNKQMVINGIKMMPIIFISTTFRTFSLVLMYSCLRYYAVIPILVTAIIQTFMAKKILDSIDSTRFKDFVLLFLPYAIISLGSGPILSPTYNENEEQKRELDKQRKRWFFYDSMTTLIVYGTSILLIIVIWETTSHLQQNLSICAFDAEKQNMFPVAGCLLGLGFCHCAISFIYMTF